MYMQWRAWHELIVAAERERGARYEWVVVARSDAFWLAPHAPLASFARADFWAVQVDDFAGLNDRHLVMRRHVAEPLLRRFEYVVTRDDALRDFIARYSAERAILMTARLVGLAPCLWRNALVLACCRWRECKRHQCQAYGAVDERSGAPRLDAAHAKVAGEVVVRARAGVCFTS